MIRTPLASALLVSLRTRFAACWAAAPDAGAGELGRDRLEIFPTQPFRAGHQGHVRARQNFPFSAARSASSAAATPNRSPAAAGDGTLCEPVSELVAKVDDPVMSCTATSQA